MRPLTRLLLRRSVLPVPIRVSGASIARFHTPPTLRFASEKVSLTQRLRRQLWGDNAPGAEDPYTQADEAAPQTQDDMTGYEQAEDGRGLPIMGLVEELGVWEVDSYFPTEKVADTEALHRALHRAAVETVVLQLNNRDLENAFGYYTPKGAETITDNVELSTQEDGSIKIAFPASDTEEAILSALAEVVPETPAESESVTTEEVEAPSIDSVNTATAESASTETAAPPAEATPETAPAEFTLEPEVSEAVEDISQPTGPPPAYLADPTHFSVPLSSPAFKFALSKRVLQLTGHRIPDAVLTRATTVGDLVPAIIAPPKPKKLSEELEPLLADLPNVRLFEKQRVGLDRETELGRARKVDPKEVYRYKGIDPERGYIGEKPYSGKVNDNFY